MTITKKRARTVEVSPGGPNCPHAEQPSNRQGKRPNDQETNEAICPQPHSYQHQDITSPLRDHVTPCNMVKQSPTVNKQPVVRKHERVPSQGSILGHGN